MKTVKEWAEENTFVFASLTDGQTLIEAVQADALREGARVIRRNPNCTRLEMADVLEDMADKILA